METMKVTDSFGREVEVEVGVDGENPVSPNNPSQKTSTYNRLAAVSPETDESKGVNGGAVQPNNPEEKAETGLRGSVPEGVSDAVVEAAQQNWYPASYMPVKSDTDEDGQPVPTYGPNSTAAVPTYSDPSDVTDNSEPGTKDDPELHRETEPATAGEPDQKPSPEARKAEWVSYAEKQGESKEEANAQTRDELAEKYSK